MKVGFRICFLVSTVFIFACFKEPLIDDNYKVIKVKGSIQIKKTGKPLQQGDIFKENTILQFNTPDSKATVINGEKGRFVITNQSISSKGNNLIPAINNIASRGGALLTIIDIQNFFKDNLCIINSVKIKIIASGYKMNADNYFYLQYKYKGDEINKQLKFDKDSLILNKDELYKVDEKPIDAPDSPEVHLYYYDKVKKGKLIADFNLIFPNENELKDEVKIIMDELKAKPDSKKKNAIFSYITEFYGNTDKGNVERWLKNNFGLK